MTMWLGSGHSTQEQGLAAEVVVFMVAPDNKGTKDQMIASLARGADKGVLVNNAGLETQDCMGIAQVLSKWRQRRC